MAGPPQLSDPSFRQFTEAGPVDTSTGQLIAAIGTGAANITGAVQTEKLNAEVGQSRTEFLELMAGLESAGVNPNDPLVSNNPGADGTIAMDLDTIVTASQQTRGDTVDIKQSELEAMAGELAAVKRGVEQGITPVRALEINTEAITRRYIDRFPGLTRQFQSIAQTALGTSNDLLSSTMRTYDDLARAAAAGTSKEQDVLDALAKRNPLVLIGSQAQRQRAIANELGSMRNEEKLRVLNSQNELEEASGGLTIPMQHFSDRMDIETDEILKGYEKAMIASLPTRLQDAGIMGISSSYNAMTDAERVATVGMLEQSKQLAIMRLDSVATSMTLNPSMQSQLSARRENLAGFYDNAIESASLGRLNEQVQASMSIIQNTNLREFEAVLGKDALIVSKIISLLPPGESLANQFWNDHAQQQLAPKLAAFAGTMTAEDIITMNGQDPSTPEGVEIVDVFNRANVQALREVMFEPDAPLVVDADANKYLRTMALQFETATPEAKKDMLDLIGTDEFANHFQGADIKTRQAMASLKQDAANYGAITIRRLGEEALTDIGEPLMRLQYGIKTLGEASGTFRAPREGEVVGNVKTGQIVNFTVDTRGIRVSPKTPAELEALGIDPSPENIANISRMSAAWNNRLITQINAYARAVENLGTGETREDIVNMALGIIKEKSTAEIVAPTPPPKQTTQKFETPMLELDAWIKEQGEPTEKAIRAKWDELMVASNGNLRN